MDVLDGYIDRVTPADLHALLRAPVAPVVSICLPIKRVEAEVQQNPIRLKNLLREAEQKLFDNGVNVAKASDMLMPAYELLEEDQAFWLHQHDGLVLFLEPDRFLSYRLPLDVEAQVVVGPRFHVRPLIRVLQHEESFFVLTLSQGSGIQLFEGTRFSLRVVELKNVPQDLDEALKYDVVERHVQFHTGAAQQGGGKRAAVFHGQGAATDDARAKKNILRYFRQIDNGVCDVLAEEQAPLVVAGIKFLQGIYQEANHYPYLVDDGVDGNPEDLSRAELHRRAWAVAEPLLDVPRQEAIDAYRHLSATARATHKLEAIVSAAYKRRVKTLFVPIGAQCWGTFDPEHDVVAQHEEAQPGSVDLLDEAIAHTLLGSGKVYVLSPNDMPTLPVAAIFRY